jgi:hemolysin activation/secretion protein
MSFSAKVGSRARMLMPIGLILLVLVPLPGSAQSIRFEVKGFLVEGDNPLGEDETRELLGAYVGGQEGLGGLEAAVNALQARLQEKDLIWHRVTLPAQTLEDGVVRLKVVEFRVGDITVSGNQHFSDANIRAGVPALRPGISPAAALLSRQLLLANEHTAKEVELKIRAAEEPEEVDVVLEVVDRRPWSLFAGINNTGTDQTGELRATIGFQHSNLFQRDHSLTATYTTSPDDFSAVQQYGGFYRVPFYDISGVLSAFAVRSDVDSGTVAGSFDVTGRGDFYGLGYRQLFTPRGAYTHSAEIGLQDRYFDNEVFFLEAAGIRGSDLGVDVRSRPLSLAYGGTYRFKQGTGGFDVAFVHNIPGGSENDDDAYGLARYQASVDWWALRLAAVLDYSLPRGWLARARFDGQYADQALIPGEQFGIGGERSVRGFDERVVSGDAGFSASVEAWTPPLKYDVRLLVFGDLGVVENEDHLPGETRSLTLGSTGVGLRWYWKDQLSLQADFAYILQGIDEDLVDGAASGDTKVHFSLVYRY